MPILSSIKAHNREKERDGVAIKQQSNAHVKG